MGIVEKYSIKELSKKLCKGNSIPRSGAEAKKVNCYCMYINSKEKPFLMVDKILEEKFYCKKWDETEKKFINDNEKIFSLSELKKDEINITHFYGYHTIQFDKFEEFSKNYFTKWRYLKIRIKDLVEKVDQYFFNKKKIYTDKKMYLLKFLVEHQIKNNSSQGIGLIQLMIELHTIKWLYHPDKDEEKRRVKLYLSSMIKSGEIEYLRDKYKVTGVALISLEKHEEEERRHKSIVRLQMGMFILTFFIALGTLLQAFK